MQRKLISSTLCSLATAMLLVAGSSTASAAPLQWWDGQGANGHYYEIRGGFQSDGPGTLNTGNQTPAGAQTEALADTTLPGFQASLVTITSQREQDFIAANMGVTIPSGGAWIGLSDSATEGTFVWVPVTVGLGTTTVVEPFSYNNWAAGEPASADFGRIRTAFDWTTNGSGNRNYILEWSPVPEPGSMVLCGLGALAMAGFGWRRRRNRTQATK